MLKMTEPHGTDARESVKPKSNSLTLMVVVCGFGQALDEPAVGGVAAADGCGEGAAAVAAGCAFAGTPTPSRPFIPAPAWPGTEQRNSYVPRPASLTFSVAERPGASTAVAFPLHAFAALVATGTVQSLKS